MEKISNQKLHLNDIPNDDAPASELHEFALSFDGYAAYPDDSSDDRCADIANRRDHSSLSRVRACLFFEQRRSRQSDAEWDHEYVLQLLAAIRKFVHEGRYRLPGVKGKNGATAADLIREISDLCEANVATIRRICRFNANREVREEIGRRLRGAHNVLGMATGNRRYGCLYIEKNLDDAQPTVAEHAVPVSALASLYEAGVPFIELVFFPVARISRLADQKLSSFKLVKSGHDEALKYILSRYGVEGAEIVLETYDGVPVEPKTWTLDNHHELIRRTPEIGAVYEAVSVSVN